MTDIQKKLFELRDEQYARFQAKLTPGIACESFIGVRVPQLRKLAAQLNKTADIDAFFNELPHKYYDENLLHSVLLQKESKDFELCLKRVETFLPFIDNWAVCDTLRPTVFNKYKARLLPKVKQWIKSDKTYTCRFGVDNLMTLYLDDDFKEEYLNYPAQVQSDEYYVNMMIAWYYATALAKQWNPTVKYLENNILRPWVHNKTIQKAIESFRITDNQKQYLRSLKRIC